MNLYRYKLSNDFKELKDKEVILFGASLFGIKVKNILESYDVNIGYFYDNDLKKQNSYVKGIKVINLNEFINYCRRNQQKIVIIISSMYYLEICEQLRSYELSNCIYSGQDVLEIDEFNLWEIDKEFMNELNITIALNDSLTKRNEFLDSFRKFKHYKKDIFIIATMLKTGTNSLLKTLKLKYQKEVFCIFHDFQDIYKINDWYKENLLYMIKKSKIITCIRDYLDMKISQFFQLYSKFTNVIPHSDFYDLQKMFNRLFIYRDIYSLNPMQSYSQKYLEDRFYDDNLNWFNREIKDIVGLDVFNYPFDKEKGYTVIKLEGGGNF